MKSALFRVSLFFAAAVFSGCNSMQRFGAPPQISVDIAPLKCKPESLHKTLPIEVHTFSDNRRDEIKGYIGFYNMPLWSDGCTLHNFEEIVTSAFRDSINNAIVLEAQTPRFILTGEIEDFFVYWEAGINNWKVGYNPLKIKLTLVDENHASVWSKTIEGKIEGSLYLHGLFRLTAEDHMKSTVKKCILNAVKQLLDEQLFWETVSLKEVTFKNAS